MYIKLKRIRSPGYDQGLLGGVLSTEQFIKAYNHAPTDTIIGTASSIYSMGAFAGCLVAGVIGLRLGRKKTIMLGCVILTIGAAIQASAPNMTALIIARVICGVGTGLNTSTVPIWIAEVSQKDGRGSRNALQLTIVVAGFAFVYWLDYAASFIKGPHEEASFRFPIAFQAFFAVSALILLIDLPESPRVLYRWGRTEEATQVLARLRDLGVDDPALVKEKDDILLAIEIEIEQTQSPFALLFGKSNLKIGRRAIITFVLFALQQLGGCTFIAYYSPIIFQQIIGLDANMSAIMSAVGATVQTLGTIVPVFIIDRVGRRKILMIGAIATLIPFVIMTACVATADGRSAYGWGAVAMLMVWNFTFGCSWDAGPWVYGAEIMPLSARHLNGAIGACGEWLFAYIIIQMAPHAIAATGWKIYILFIIFNAIQFFFVFFFCPETSGKTLEEIDHIFDPVGLDGLEESGVHTPSTIPEKLEKA